MCRNYDAGECEEPGCKGRVTCHDFTDNRCVEHSYNGRGLDRLYAEADAEEAAEDLRTKG